MCLRMYCSVIVIFTLLSGLVTQAELIGSDTITTRDLSAYCHRKTSSGSGSSSVNSTWTLQADSFARESEYDKLQRQQAELCRQGKIGAPGQLQESCSMWRFKYIDEQKASGFEVKIVDESLDTRLANTIYTALAISPVVPDFFKVNGDDPSESEQNFRSLEGPQVDAEQCHWQLKQMVAQLDELEARLEIKRQNSSFRLGLDERHIRLARAMDSYGRYEAGLFLGKFNSMGSFKECESSRLLLPARKPSDTNPEVGDHELVKTRFCWARMDVSKHMSASLKARQTDSFEVSEHVLQLGVCLPKSCHTRSFLKQQAHANQADGAIMHTNEQDQNRQLLQHLIDSQFKLPSSLYIEESLPLHSVYCLADEQSDYKVPISGKIALAFVGAWFLLAAYATYYQEMGLRPRARNKKNDDEASGTVDLVGSSFVEKHQWAQGVIDCMNLKKSWQDFVGEDYDKTDSDSAGQQQQPVNFTGPQRVNLDTMNPIKALGCMFVVLGHALIVISVFSMDSLITFNRLEKDPIALGMVTGTLIVDTFFVITGIIMGYIAMSKSAHFTAKRAAQASQEQIQSGSVDQGIETSNSMPVEGEVGGISKLAHRKVTFEPIQQVRHKQQAQQQHMAIVFVKHWVHNIVSRYLRLVPLFFLAYWLKRTVLVYYMNFGQPYMDNGFNRDTSFGACKRESWWTPFNTMSAFLPLSQQCLPQAWSIASDLFYTITVTPIVLIMTKRPRLALILGSIVCLISWMWSIKVHLSLPAEKESEIIHLRAHGFSAMFGSLSHLYTNPHLRFSSILVGVLSGYMIHVYDSNKDFEWPQWMRGWATQLSLMQVVALFIGVIHINELKHIAAGYERFLFANLPTTGRVLWAIANGIILTRMTTDWRNTYLMRQSASKFWTVMVRLNLAILLLHMDVLYYHVSSSLVADYFTYRNMIALFSATYVICIPLAIFIHIVYDNPIYKLTKRYVLSLI